jgi:hypothetical protein
MAVIFFAGLAVKACRDLATLSWTEVLWVVGEGANNNFSNKKISKKNLNPCVTVL